LLELNKDVVKFHIELSSLFKQQGKLLLHDDGFVNLLEVLVLRRVVANLSDGCIQALRVCNNHLGNFLFLFFEGLILGEMDGILLFELFEYSLFVSCPCMNAHQLFHSVEAIMHGDTFFHNLFLFSLDVVKLVQCFLNGLNSGVIFNLGSRCIDRDTTAKLLAGFAK